jgi:hypothetical protein
MINAILIEKICFLNFLKYQKIKKFLDVEIVDFHNA